MVWQQPNLRMQRSARGEIVPLPLTPLRAPADAGVRRLAACNDTGGAFPEDSVIVYVLQHSHTVDTGEEDVKLIGVYSSREGAETAFARAAALPGFRNAADGFSIDAYELDENHWVEGFVSE